MLEAFRRIRAEADAAWYRILNAGSTESEDGAVGAGGEMTLDNADIISGGVVSVGTVAFTQADGN